MNFTRAAKAATAVGIIGLGTTGCLADSGTDTGGGGSTNTSDSIEIMYGFTGPGSDKFQAALADYAESEGITIEFSPTPDFNSLVNTRVQGNDLPDIAIFPQPGIMASIASTGKLADLSEVLDMDDLNENVVPGALAAGAVDGTQYAVPLMINVKSIVFHPKQAWEAAGYEAPQTLDELMTLTTDIAATGTTPWCLGLESGAATGWPATDWIENLLLAQQGAETYDAWVRHEIPFDDAVVDEAAATMEQLLLTDGHVNGGRAAIAASNFGTAANPMFDETPGCMMYRQGNFVAEAGGFPEDVVAELDERVGIFPMPGTTPEDKPVLGGGDLAALFSADNESAQKVLAFMTAEGFGEEWAQQTGFISPRKDFDLSSYPNELTAQVAQIAYDSTAFVFDGSDQMPGAVGSGSFWREMTAWVSGSQDRQTTLANIEASWPAS